MVFKKLIGFVLVFMLLCANGQLIYAFIDNNNLDNSSKSFFNNVRQSFNDLNSNLRSFGDNVHEASELGLGVAFGTTVIVGPNEEYKNLKDAVEHSKSGDTLLLVQGNYTGEENTNINISHDLKIKTLVPFATWITYNNTDYSHEEFYKLFSNPNDSENMLPKEVMNNSIEHKENATILNGDGKQIFNVNNGVNFELNGLFLVNGSSLKGGAIHNKGNLKINDSYFINNQVFDDNVRDQDRGYGGAIYNEGNLSIDSTNFENNRAEDYSYGGAIYNDGTISSLNNCMFQSNYADNGGGAIYNKNKISSINKCIFMYNSADSTTSHGGGAILNEGNDEISFKGVTFYSNLAISAGGGAIDSYSSKLTFDDTNFILNFGSYGGAIRSLSADSLKLYNSSFNYNTADHQGGSLYFTGDNFNSRYSNFTGNVANHDGGGLYLGSCGNSEIHYNNFTMNVGDNGGAIYQDGGYLNLETNFLIFNSANQTTSNGGAVYTKNGMFNINNNTFDRNYAIGSGGAIYNQNSKGLINYTILHENFCNDNGGALYNNHFNVSINNCSVYSNYAIGSGGSIYNDKEGTNFLVNQTLFGNNTANKDGGSICNLADSFFTYFSGFGSSKTVEGSGGALYNKGNNIIIELSNFQYNFAEEDGGGIYNNGNAISTTNVNMTGNMAHGYGGGYYDESNHLQAELTNFKDNAAGKRGNDYYTESDKEAVIIGTMIGLSVILIVITAVSIIVPAAAGLYGAVAVGATAAGWSAGVCTAAVYGVQALVAICASLIFIGIEEAISSACPEFEEWESEYWYIATIVFVVCAVGTALITSHIVDGIYTLAGALNHIGINGSMAISAGAAIDFINSLAKGLAVGGAVAAVIGRIAYVVGILFQYVHLDDWLINLIALGSKGVSK
ncbi:MAG: hypothetical protein LBD03_07470 [Methanobrevibacter sp.]|jgi:predicted outer membrane repeat protein|nr:hypothetical protein [Candidatus Methanovirga procula]